MARAMLKCVPRSDPNAEGVWLNRKVPLHLLAIGKMPHRFNSLSLYAPKGMYVVAYIPTKPTLRRGIPTVRT